jgi:hypothetical protein
MGIHVAPQHPFPLDIEREWSVGRDMRDVPKQPTEPVSPEALSAEIARLATLPLTALKAAWAAEFRRPPPKGLWPDLLLRTLAWRLQEKVLGGHDKAIVRLLETYGRQKEGAGRPKLLKTGTVLVREFGGTRHTVTILPEGFAWNDRTYPSLTAIARIITGTNWNGPRFFGLREGRGGVGVMGHEASA